MQIQAVELHAPNQSRPASGKYGSAQEDESNFLTTLLAAVMSSVQNGNATDEEDPGARGSMATDGTSALPEKPASLAALFQGNPSTFPGLVAENPAGAVPPAVQVGVLSGGTLETVSPSLREALLMAAGRGQVAAVINQTLPEGVSAIPVTRGDFVAGEILPNPTASINGESGKLLQTSVINVVSPESMASGNLFLSCALVPGVTLNDNIKKTDQLNRNQQTALPNQLPGDKVSGNNLVLSQTGIVESGEPLTANAPNRSGVAGGGGTDPGGNAAQQAPNTTSFAPVTPGEGATIGAPSTGYPANLPAATSELMAMAINRAVIRQHAGQTILRLKLVPEHLGEVTIRLVYNGGVLSAEFYTTSQAAREAISGSLPQLQHHLAQHNLRLEGVTVQVGQNGPGWAGGTGTPADTSPHGGREGGILSQRGGHFERHPPGSEKPAALLEPTDQGIVDKLI